MKMSDSFAVSGLYSAYARPICDSLRLKMPGDPTLMRLLGALYAAPTEPEVWEVFFAEYSRLTGA